MEEVVEQHESFGMAGLSRVTIGGGGCSLFGSSIRHASAIMLRVHTAERRRSLHHTWFSARKEIVEVYLSPAQFADMLTNMNVGDGVPCTIRHASGKRMPDPPSVEQRELFEQEFKADCVQVANDLSEFSKHLASVFDSGKFGKKVQDDIMGRLAMVIQHVQSNMPFVQSSFNEAMDKTVTEAKAEVEAFVESKIHSLGIDALREEVQRALTVAKESPALTVQSVLK